MGPFEIGTGEPYRDGSRIWCFRSDNDQFRVSYTSEHCEADVDFVWRADIEGQSDGTITFAFAGEARSTFARNRIGLCVLHPMDECAGLAATVRRTNGTQVEARFPELVAIEQPVEGLSDFGSVTYDAGHDARVQIAFEGEVFETEDQRNWIDASFKTYGTPLSLPRPVTIAKGTRVEQRVTLRLQGVDEAPSAAKPVRTSAARRPDQSDYRMPAIGLGVDGSDPYAGWHRRTSPGAAAGAHSRRAAARFRRMGDEPRPRDGRAARHGLRARDRALGR